MKNGTVTSEWCCIRWLNKLCANVSTFYEMNRYSNTMHGVDVLNCCSGFPFLI